MTCRYIPHLRGNTFYLQVAVVWIHLDSVSYEAKKLIIVVMKQMN